MCDDNFETNENAIKKPPYQAPTVVCLDSTKIKTAYDQSNIPESKGGLLSES